MVVNSFSGSCSEIVNKLQFLERVYDQEFEDNVEYDEVLEIQTLCRVDVTIMTKSCRSNNHCNSYNQYNFAKG